MDVVCDICGEVFGELSEERQALVETDTIILGREPTGTAFFDDIRKVAELHLLQDEDFTLLKELVTSEGSEAAWRQFHEESGGIDDKQLRGIALLVLGKKMAAFTTSLEADKAWLKNNPGHSRKKLAVDLRVSEKTILMDWMNYIKSGQQAAEKHQATAKAKSKTTKRQKTT
jgi:hypothetical protein